MAKTTLADFYQSEIEIQKTQKAWSEQQIREIKRCADLKVRTLHKEIDSINLTIIELEKLYNQEREAELKYATTAKPETL